MLEFNALQPGFFRYSTCVGYNVYIRFTYLKIFVTWDFWFNSNTMKTQYKFKLRLGNYSNCNIQFDRHTSVILIPSLCDMLTVMMLGVPSAGKEYVGWSQLKPIAHFEILFVSCLVFILCVWLTYIYTPPHASLANSGRNSHSFNELGEKYLHHQLIHSTAIGLYLKERLPSSPLCDEEKSAALQQPWSVTLYIISWALLAHHPCPSPLGFLAF